MPRAVSPAPISVTASAVAKQGVATLVSMAQCAPVVVYRYGKPAAVVLSADAFDVQVIEAASALADPVGVTGVSPVPVDAWPDEQLPTVQA